LTKEDLSRWTYMDATLFEPAKKVPKEIVLPPPLQDYEDKKPACFGRFPLPPFNSSHSLGCFASSVDCKYKAVCMAKRLEEQSKNLQKKMMAQVGSAYAEFRESIRHFRHELPKRYEMEVCISCWPKEKLDLSAFKALWKTGKIFCRAEPFHFVTVYQNYPRNCPYVFEHEIATREAHVEGNQASEEEA